MTRAELECRVAALELQIRQLTRDQHWLEKMMQALMQRPIGTSSTPAPAPSYLDPGLQVVACGVHGYVGVGHCPQCCSMRR